MHLATYVGFNGQCAEALRYYEKHLGGTITAMFTFADMPGGEEMPPEARGGIMHARLELGGTTLMGSDTPPGMDRADPSGFHVSVHPTSVDEADRVFAALSDGGSVEMPIQETFWAARFGMVVDRFGIPWMVNCEKPHEIG